MSSCRQTKRQPRGSSTAEGTARGEEERFSYRFWTVGGLHTATVKEESDRGGSFALSFAEGIHQLLEGGRPLDLEEDFVVVVGHFDVEMLALASSLGLFRGTWASVVV